MQRLIFSAQPGGSRDPVLWAKAGGGAGVNPDYRASRKHWVPASAGMSGKIFVISASPAAMGRVAATGYEPVSGSCLNFASTLLRGRARPVAIVTTAAR